MLIFLPQKYREGPTKMKVTSFTRTEGRIQKEAIIIIISMMAKEPLKKLLAVHEMITTT